MLLKQWFSTGVPRTLRVPVVQSKGSASPQFKQRINNLWSSIPKIYFVIKGILKRTSPWFFYRTKCFLLAQVHFCSHFMYNLRKWTFSCHYIFFKNFFNECCFRRKTTKNISQGFCEPMEFFRVFHSSKKIEKHCTKGTQWVVFISETFFDFMTVYHRVY